MRLFAGGVGLVAWLTDVSGTLYGTTAEGGAYGNGVVFSTTTGGAVKLLHNFQKTVGTYPEAGMIYIGGRLVGTTYSGGVFDYGTVFSITS